MTTCNVQHGYRRFGRTCCTWSHGTHYTTWRHNPNFHRCTRFKHEARTNTKFARQLSRQDSLYPGVCRLKKKNYPKTHLKILSVERLTSSKFHCKDPQILGVTVHNLDARTTWRPIFVHACPKQYKNPNEIFLK